MRSVLAILAFGTVVASASACLAEGAVAVGGERYGISYNQKNTRTAERRALEVCNDDCRIVLRFDGGCASFASDGHGGRGWARDENSRKSESGAVRYCRQYSKHPKGCEVRMTQCDRS